jgi:mono/diheme cytochrome c family protein
LRINKFLSLGLILIVALAATVACSDNSIDTRVTPLEEPAMSFPVDVTNERVSAGENIYARNCSSCHGPVNGRPTLPGAPAHGDAGHTWHHPDRLLFQWILDRPPLATTMPAFRGTLSEEEVAQVLAYIKSSWLPEIQDRQNEGSVQYEAQVVEFGSE